MIGIDVLLVQEHDNIQQLDFLNYCTLSETIVQVEIQNQSDFYYLLTKSGKVYSFASRNDCGQLGVNDLDSRQVPTLVEFDELNSGSDHIVSVKLGEKHALFLSKLGRVFSCGNNEFGQLGLPLRKECRKPVEISSQHFDSPIHKIFTGPFQSFFISEKKSVYGCGNHDLDQVFIREYGDFKTIYKVFEPTNISIRLYNSSGAWVEKIVSGETNTAFIFNNGKVMLSASCGLYCEYDSRVPEKCYAAFNTYTSMSNVEHLVFAKYNIIQLLKNGECSVVGFGDLLGLPPKEEVVGFENISLEEEPIEDVSCGGFHVVLKTSKRRLLSFGSNRFLQLGQKNNTSSRESFRELKCIELPFEWKEEDNVQVFCGNTFTIVMHETRVESFEELISKQVIIPNDTSLDKSNCYHIENSDIYVFLPMIKNISKNLFSLLTNREITDRLEERELKTLSQICEFICCELALTTEEKCNKNGATDDIDPYTNHLFLIFDRFLSVLSKDNEHIESDLVTCLFLLNDIADIGVYFKNFIFNELSKRINVENVMDLLKQTSNYLSMKLLKRSENSIMMLFIKKCLSFMKKNFSQCQHLYNTSDAFLKIKPKIEEMKNTFFGVQVQWNEEPMACTLTESLVDLLDNPSMSDLNVIINEGKDEVLKLHRNVLAINSPVLSVTLNQNESSETLDLYEFNTMMIDQLNEIFFQECSKTRSEILKLVIQMCYAKFENEYDLETLICILFIAHQFQMEFPVKFCCTQLIERMKSNQAREYFNLLFYLASILEVDSHCKDFTETFIVYCANSMNSDSLQQVLKRYSEENFTPSFIQRVRALQDLIYKKHVPQN